MSVVLYLVIFGGAGSSRNCIGNSVIYVLPPLAATLVWKEGAYVRLMTVYCYGAHGRSWFSPYGINQRLRAGLHDGSA